MKNYCNGPYGDLDGYTNKDASAWGKVWSGTWPSRASLMATGGRNLSDFGVSGRAGDI